MNTTTHTPATYTAAIKTRLQNDLENNRQYLKVCRSFIEQAEGAGDGETVTFWAHQQDRTIQNIRAINYQLKNI